MRKYILLLAIMTVSVSLMAVPARRAFTDCMLTDGTTVQLTQAGDELAHWYEDAEGNVYVSNPDGTFAPSAVTRAEMCSRRHQALSSRNAHARRAPMEFGVTPNLAPKGIVLLVNFADAEMNAEHTKAIFDELFNSDSCTVNSYKSVHYPSAAEYFSAQSLGAYRPQFDVFGPLTLSQNYAYYGNNVTISGVELDEYAADAVIEACILAKQQYDTINFADYDSDKDGFVDFVYVIYAGRGEADGGLATTIWPHNWNISELVDSDLYPTKYDKSATMLDGVYLDSYAMSAELDNNGLAGIGTLCHEFGHVLGLPDFYDTQYGTNYTQGLTPNDWDVMDGGAYNGNGHCPPNYSPWEKAFMGWLTPENPGSEGSKLTLYANGTDDYVAYQINESGEQQTVTQEGVNYYIENRQKRGWDEYLPAAGMLIWRVNYRASAWTNNVPNNTSRSPGYTLVIPSGKRIGGYNGAENVWPYRDINSWSGVAGKPLTDITVNGSTIELIYINDPDANTAVELPEVQSGAVKMVRDGKMVIVHGDAVYSILGVRE